MNKNTIAKSLVKGGIGIAVSALIGAMIKLEKNVDTRIDAHFAAKNAINANN